jgi:murein DD-endopeptidase MepM/ murein hydrolase activator NlpD
MLINSMLQTFKLSSVLFLILTNESTFSQQTVYELWHKTDMLIRDNRIDKDKAIDSINLYVQLTMNELKSTGVKSTKKADWVYPLSDWTWNSYRTNGKDYKSERFDYFQGGEYKGHPAHDIFILDKDSNGVEDSTGRKVKAVSMVNGVVISLHNEWKTGDKLRSGNYVKIFDPGTKAIFYYSHLDTVFVNVGDVVKAGDAVAYVGRTGRKAIHGKTHLHIAYYKIDEGYPKPVDIIEELYKAEKK